MLSGRSSQAGSNALVLAAHRFDGGEASGAATPPTGAGAGMGAVGPEEASVAALRLALEQRLGASRYEIWFGEGVELGLDGQALRIRVPNAFFRDWIQNHFARTVVEVAENLAGRPLCLQFDVAGESEPELGDVVRRKPADEFRGTPVPISIPAATPLPPPTPAPPTFRPQSPRPSAELATQPEPAEPGRPVRRLENFVAGTGNRLALAAAVEMVQTLGTAFNPLLIHGGVGIGKSHILEAIARGLRARQPGLNVVFTTAESFTNGFLDAIRTNALSRFRSRFRNAEAWIVDDVHFLAAKRATQDEFLHTFNELAFAGRPIVMATDQHPRSLNRLSDELVTRFLGGMVVKIEPPDAVTRLNIVRAKAGARGIDLPDAVATYIAEHVRTSIRELEGAVQCVLAHAMLSHRKIDLALARNALGETIRCTTQAVALRDIELAVCQLFRIDVELIRSGQRSRSVAQPRMLAMFLARKLAGISYSEIGRYFGGRNHSTVISAEKKVRAWLDTDQQATALPGFETMADIVTALERSLGA